MGLQQGPQLVRLLRACVRTQWEKARHETWRHVGTTRKQMVMGEAASCRGCKDAADMPTSRQCGSCNHEAIWPCVAARDKHHSCPSPSTSIRLTLGTPTNSERSS